MDFLELKAIKMMIKQVLKELNQPVNCHPSAKLHAANRPSYVSGRGSPVS